jgi:hypothetical protein
VVWDVVPLVGMGLVSTLLLFCYELFGSRLFLKDTHWIVLVSIVFRFQHS